MCGIAGYLSTEVTVSREDLLRSRDCMAHRGPDDAGLWLSNDGRVGLVHRRLSIVDLRPEGRQPMSDVQQRAWVTFNGEIYNYRELRAELEGEVHQFVTRTDTEVLLASYLAWGTKCVQRFNGMWSFAIWDTEKKQLFLSRDRFGKKPLYYTQHGGRFHFASQLKGLSLFADIPWKVDLSALNAYLGLGYVPADLSILSPAMRLPPGHNALVDLDTGEMKVWRYWSVPYFEHLPDNSGAVDSSRLLDELESLVQNAVIRRLEADVPVGVLLSGGVDSSIVAALAARAKGGGNVKTFCIKMPDPRMDESGYARSVADFLGTDHYELLAAPASLDLLPELSEFCDEPLGDSSLLPAYVLSKLTREHVTVALGGDGGDEVFGGYRHYPQTLAYSRRWSWVPRLFWPLLGKATMRCLPVGMKGRNLLASFLQGPEKSFVFRTPYFDPYARQRLLRPEIVDELGRELPSPEYWRLGFWDLERSLVARMLALDLQTYLPDDILFKVDRASMAVALEVRAPFLDLEVVEFAFRSIPDSWKVENGQRRKIQIALAQRLMPNVLDTDRKMGFSIPLFTWLRDPGVQTRAKSWIYDSPLRGYIQETSLDNLFRDHLAGRHNDSRLFALIMAGLSLNRLLSR